MKHLLKPNFSGRIGLIFLTFLLFGCGDQKDLPPAASKLVEPSGKDAASVLPHTIDSATEFEGALDSLAEGVEEPELRITESTNMTIVRVEKRTEPDDTSFEATDVEEVTPIEQDWFGIVLLPDRTKMSKAHTTKVELERIEAHPLIDERLRVWVRVGNQTGTVLHAQIACNFSDSDRSSEKTDFVPVLIPPEETLEAYFMSPMANVTSYTILVR